VLLPLQSFAFIRDQNNRIVDLEFEPTNWAK
jgi:hypothetical protein